MHLSVPGNLANPNLFGKSAGKSTVVVVLVVIVIVVVVIVVVVVIKLPYETEVVGIENVKFHKCSVGI